MGPTQPRAPSLVSGLDVRSLPLTSIEAFVLSRVDGHTSLDDIAHMVGLDQAQTQTILERLITLGAVRWQRPACPAAPGEGQSSRQASPEGVRAHRDDSGGERTGSGRRARSSDSGAGPSHGPGAGAGERTGAGRRARSSDGAPGPSHKPAEGGLQPDPSLDLDVELQARILATHARLGKANHYELLEVAADADKAQIRAAYFALAKVFHPDTLFRRRIGGYKPLMEAVFERLTNAYEVLGRKGSRERYDAELARSRETAAQRAEPAPDRESNGRPAASAVASDPIEAPSPAGPRRVSRLTAAQKRAHAVSKLRRGLLASRESLPLVRGSYTSNPGQMLADRMSASLPGRQRVSAPTPSSRPDRARSSSDGKHQQSLAAPKDAPSRRKPAKSKQGAVSIPAARHSDTSPGRRRNRPRQRKVRQ
ncbi:MAG: DnaJ domain-containing protein [Proteobacteria bacterium]|nr:DnaJ domain-containing protein [Pseudomonadota bacterium]